LSRFPWLASLRLRASKSMDSKRGKVAARAAALWHDSCRSISRLHKRHSLRCYGNYGAAVCAAVGDYDLKKSVDLCNAEVLEKRILQNHAPSIPRSTGDAAVLRHRQTGAVGSSRKRRWDTPTACSGTA
jgi:hypothetical protein